MKKTLRSIALAAVAIPMIASAQFNVETVWMNGVVDGNANPIPGLDAGWTKPTEAGGTTADTRFATAQDGKILVNNHISNEIQAWDGSQFTTVCKLPTVTSTVWNGTALSTDDAGNVILNFGFTDPTVSVSNWAVLTNGVLTQVNLSTPLSELNLNGRLDIISHIVGDVTSEKGGIGYSTIKSTDHLVMFHFKGDGTKVTSVTAKASSAVDGLAAIYGASVQTETYQAAPKYLTVDEILNAADPENQFYLPVGKLGASTATVYGFETGLLSNFNGNVFAPLIVGNRGFGSAATFALGGKKYIVRNYVAADSPHIALFTNWKNIMAFGVFDEDGTCYATWEGSTFTNGFGSETFTVEPVDENTVNIYVYAATGTKDDDSGTIPGCYAAMVKLTTGDAPVVGGEPDGSEANPYLIATAEDLCNAYKKTVEGKLVYFKQTADIDMAGVTDYTTFVGGDAVYGKSIYYDGDNHIIKNFAPVDRVAGVGENAYYNTSIFGTPSGTIKNLGVVDANVKTDWIEAGILGGFAGTGAHTATSEMIVDNVFVTGKLVNEKNPIPFGDQLAGGMFGKNGQPLTITNSYVQVDIDGDTYAAGFVAKTDNNVTITDSYVSGTFTGTKPYLVAASNTSFPDDITLTNVVCFGEGEVSNVATIGTATVVPADDAAGIATVQSWNAFNAGKLFNGLPALNWQDAPSGISAITTDTENAPAEYFNLQGVRVANPDNGIYIVRRGNNVTKEMIRK